MDSNLAARAGPYSPAHATLGVRLTPPSGAESPRQAARYSGGDEATWHGAHGDLGHRPRSGGRRRGRCERRSATTRRCGSHRQAGRPWLQALHHGRGPAGERTGDAGLLWRRLCEREAEAQAVPDDLRQPGRRCPAVERGRALCARRSAAGAPRGCPPGEVVPANCGAEPCSRARRRSGTCRSS